MCIGVGRGIGFRDLETEVNMGQGRGETRNVIYHDGWEELI